MSKVKLSIEEAELLQMINEGVPASVRQRYEALNRKLHEERITPNEHQEFLALVEQIKQADAERLHRLMELALLRNVPVDTLIDQLGIRQPIFV